MVFLLLHRLLLFFNFGELFWYRFGVSFDVVFFLRERDKGGGRGGGEI